MVFCKKTCVLQPCVHVAGRGVRRFWGSSLDPSRLEFFALSVSCVLAVYQLLYVKFVYLGVWIFRRRRPEPCREDVRVALRGIVLQDVPLHALAEEDNNSHNNNNNNDNNMGILAIIIIIVIIIVVVIISIVSIIVVIMIVISIRTFPSTPWEAGGKDFWLYVYHYVLSIYLCLFVWLTGPRRRGPGRRRRRWSRPWRPCLTNSVIQYVIIE